MLLDLYPIEHREKIAKLLIKIENLPFTPARKCRIWDIGRPYREYPHVSICGMTYRISRLVLEQKLGRKLYGNFALHNCDHPRCIAEDHLYEGNNLVNMEDLRFERGDVTIKNIGINRRIRIGLNTRENLRFFKGQFVLVIEGSLKGRTAKVLKDIPDFYKLSSKIEITIAQTNATHWVKIGHLNRG